METFVALNLGSGAIDKPTSKTPIGVNPAYATKHDYINIDIQRLKGVDIIADVSCLPIKDSCADWILASHILEHFGHGETQKVLREWLHVLKVKGVLEVLVPNLTRELYEQPEWKPRILDDEDDGYRIAFSLFGGQRDQYDYHKNAFNWRYLRESLEKAGFINIKRDITAYPYSLDEPYGLKVYASKILTWKKSVHDNDIASIWENLEYEKVRKVSVGDVVVDAGAGIGIFTVKASLQAGENGFVYAFEPEPENFKLLSLNTKNLGNVKVFRKALWSSCGTQQFVIHAANWGGHTFYPEFLRPDHRLKTLDVETVTLDKTVKRKVTFLKIDVEGAELEVLKGATHILEDCKPFIAVEVHTVILYEQVKQFLQHFRYKPCEENPKVKVRTHYFMACI